MNCDEACYMCGAKAWIWVLFPPNPARHCCQSCAKLPLIVHINRQLELSESTLLPEPQR